MIIAGRASSPCDVLVEPILGFILPETHQPPHLSASPLTIQKPARGLRPHTPRCPVYFVSHPKTLHITTPHTRFLLQYAHLQRDFPTRPRRRRIFRPGFSPPKPISPPDFSSPTPKFPGGFIATDARFPPPDLKKLRSIAKQNLKNRESGAAKKQKRLLLPSMPISLSKHIGTVKSAATHHKRSKQSHTTNAAT